jgi:arginine deiminase
MSVIQGQHRKFLLLAAQPAHRMVERQLEEYNRRITRLEDELVEDIKNNYSELREILCAVVENAEGANKELLDGVSAIYARMERK